MHLRAETVTDVAVVIVHYDTPGLTAAAVSALRADFDRSGLRAECVIVDNGNRAADADVLRGLGAVATVISAGRNLGYAGGVNFGIAHTSASASASTSAVASASAPAPLLVAMNPDVIVEPGCLAALCRELRAGAAAAGPRFSWDRAGRLLLPPTERRDLTSASLARLTARGPRWARLARAVWRRHARRHWLARRSVRSFALSGALLAIRRDAWDRIGPFDDRFQLYFEETDWLARLARDGGQARYVPSARAAHHYNSSARHEPAAAAWFAASARRFEEKHGGRASRWLASLTSVEPGKSGDSVKSGESGEPGEPARSLGSRGSRGTRGSVEAVESLESLEQRKHEAPAIDVTSAAGWIEVSSAAAGYPAAAERLDARADRDPAVRRWRLPDDVWDHLAPGRYTLRVVGHAGREQETVAFLR
jgi:GT2 family glycosyltransferase